MEKKGLAFKPSHSILVEGIFLFPVILKRKLIFENIKGVYKVLEGCSVKEKRQGKQHLEKTQWQIKHANDSKFVSLQSLAHAEMLFGSVGQYCVAMISSRNALKSVKHTNGVGRAFELSNYRGKFLLFGATTF